MVTATQLRLAELLRHNQVHRNLRSAVLVEHAIRRNEARLASNGALVAYTGRTGRSPKDKFTIKDKLTANQVHWGSVNQPFDPDRFDALYERVMEFLQGRELFVQDLYAGADPSYRLPIQVVNEMAWHNLFVRALFIRPTNEEMKSHQPEFTILAAPTFKADPSRDSTNSEAFILVNFTRRIVLIGGTAYAGEMKKSIFGAMNFLLPQRGVFPMHCSANIGRNGKTALFFGLSGTGKTTLSADPERRLIGDDEHGWSPSGVFNFEGGCYAKCIRLSKDKEPQIWNALRFGAVLENVVLSPGANDPNYDDDSITENTRAAYPVDYIDNAQIPGIGGHPNHVVFLTADAFGVLPPISRLTPEQAMYHFFSGYTAKVAGTERGLGNEPQPEFSTCFGSPFLPLDPSVYGNMLRELIAKHNVDCWLVNTGWTGGKFGTGSRMPIKVTRTLLTAALDGSLRNVEFRTDKYFGFEVPTALPGVPSDILDPVNTWKDKAEFDKTARALVGMFQKNFAKFEAKVDADVRAAAPEVKLAAE
jgi:phosphoenolpyruvate carboxykinase (ATP)